MSFITEDQLVELDNIVSDKQDPIGYVSKVRGHKATVICSRTAIEVINDVIGQGDTLDVGLSPSQIGSMIKIKVSEGFVLASVTEVEAADNDDELIIELDYVGHADIRHDTFNFVRGISKYPVPGQDVYSVTFDEVTGVFGQMHSDCVVLGTVSPLNVTPATISVDSMLSKHFAILGSTGTGKSSTTALILRRIMTKMRNAHVLMLDPHDEYYAAFEDIAVRFDIDNLKLPYWLMNFEEHVEMLVGPRNVASRQAEIDILRRTLLAARIESAGNIPIEKITVNTPIPYKLTHVTGLIEKEMGRLENASFIAPYVRLKNKIDNLRKDTRFGFMFSGLRSTDNLDRVIGDLFRFPVNDKPMTIVDLSGIPGDIVNIVVSIIMRTVFDFAVWSKGSDAKPVLMVCEEAHRYVPTDKSTIFSSTKKAIDRIAREGRKYGVSLGLISQRPADLSEASLSQCGTFFVMRMNNEKDKRFIENVLPEGSVAMVDSLSALDNGEALVVGEGVAAPVKIKMDFLRAEQRPKSSSPHFSSAWLTDIENNDFIDETITKWRLHGR